MNGEAEEFWLRRNANEIAQLKINNLVNSDGEGPLSE